MQVFSTFYVRIYSTFAFVILKIFNVIIDYTKVKLRETIKRMQINL